MLRIHRRTLLKVAMPAALSTAALLAAGGSPAALASPATATAMSLSSDPIGTTAPLSLTLGAP